ncbi:hypothetical protein G3P65_002400 [Vibrio parahaemolyticus]|nr:hypothetical protein [Vibrio parahaemolyticus]
MRALFLMLAKKQSQSKGYVNQITHFLKKNRANNKQFGCFGYMLHNQITNAFQQYK